MKKTLAYSYGIAALITLGIMIVSHVAYGAPTSTIIQNLILKNPTSSILSTNSEGLVVATTTSAGGGLATSTLGDYSNGNVLFVFDPSTVSASSGLVFNSSTGMLGIGTSTPKFKLHIYSTSTQPSSTLHSSARFESAYDAGLELIADSDNDTNETGTPYIYLSSDGDYWKTILQLNQTSTIDALGNTWNQIRRNYFLWGNITNDANGIQFGTRSTARVTIDDQGLVGIGTAFPSSTLHVVGDLIAGTSTLSLSYLTATNTPDIFAFTSDLNSSTIRSSRRALNLTLGTSSSKTFQPSITNDIDFGTSTRRWKSGTFGTGGISTNGLLSVTGAGNSSMSGGLDVTGDVTAGTLSVTGLFSAGGVDSDWVPFTDDGTFSLGIPTSSIAGHRWDLLVLAGTAVTNRGSNIASAATLALGNDGNYFHITGNTTISAISMSDNSGQAFQSGVSVTLEFEGSPTLVHSDDGGADLILEGGVNHKVVPGEVMIFVADEGVSGSSQWREVSRSSGSKLAGVGTSTVFVAVGGTLGTNVTQVANAAAAETILASSTIATSTLLANGDSITFKAAGTFAGTLATDKRLKVTISTVGQATTTVFDTGNLAITAASDWVLTGHCERTGANTQRCGTVLNTSFASLGAYADYATGAVTSTLPILFELRGSGTNASDVVKEMFRVGYDPIN